MFSDVDRFSVPPRLLVSGVGTGVGGTGTGVAVLAGIGVGLGVAVGGIGVAVGIGDGVGDGTVVAVGAIVGKGVGVGSTLCPQPATKARSSEPRIADQTNSSLMQAPTLACPSGPRVQTVGDR